MKLGVSALRVAVLPLTAAPSAVSWIATVTPAGHLSVPSAFTHFLSTSKDVFFSVLVIVSFPSEGSPTDPSYPGAGAVSITLYWISTSSPSTILYLSKPLNVTLGLDLLRVAVLPLTAVPSAVSWTPTVTPSGHVVLPSALSQVLSTVKSVRSFTTLFVTSTDAEPPSSSVTFPPSVL